MTSVLLFNYLAALLFFSQDSNYQRIDYYYANNHLDSQYLSQARDICLEILKTDPDDCQALWRLARNELTFAERKPSRSEKLAAYEDALQNARHARRANPSSPDAHYLFGVILGRTAQVRGVVNFLTQIKAMKEAFEQAIALDPKHAGALHALGVWYAEASAFYTPWTAHAIEYCTRALASDSNYSMTYITLARVYIRQKNYPLARQVLETCLALKSPSIPSDFYNYSKPEAEKYLVQIRFK